jgi:hypothetical protein
MASSALLTCLLIIIFVVINNAIKITYVSFIA